MQNISNDPEIKILKTMYQHCINKENSRSAEEIAKLSQVNINKALEALHISLVENNYIGKKYRDSKGNIAIFYIKIKAKLLLYEIEKSRKAFKQSRNAIYTSIFAIIVSIIALGISTYYNHKDHSGDLDWQKQQIEKLEEINKSLKNNTHSSIFETQ